MAKVLFLMIFSKLYQPEKSTKIKKIFLFLIRGRGLFLEWAYAAASIATTVIRHRVSASVRHKPVFCRNGWTDRAGFRMEASFNKLSYNVFLCILKLRALPAETLPRSLDLENFATTQLVRQRWTLNVMNWTVVGQTKLIVLATIDVRPTCLVIQFVTMSVQLFAERETARRAGLSA